MTTKTKTTKRSKPKPVPETGEDLDYRPLFRAFREAFEWALDVAASIARDFPDELDAVERVRTFLRARVTGRAADISVEDVMFTFGLLIGAIDRDLGPIGNSGASTPLHVAIADLWEQPVSRRFCPTSWLDHYLSHARARA